MDDEVRLGRAFGRYGMGGCEEHGNETGQQRTALQSNHGFQVVPLRRKRSVTPDGFDFETSNT